MIDLFPLTVEAKPVTFGKSGSGWGRFPGKLRSRAGIGHGKQERAHTRQDGIAKGRRAGSACGTYWQASASGALHAFHIHINSFLVAARAFSSSGSTQSFELLPAMIWRDTIRIDRDPNSGTAAGAPVHMVSQQYDYAGWCVMHCHVLDHKDFGMMVSVQIGS